MFSRQCGLWTHLNNGVLIVPKLKKEVQDREKASRSRNNQ
jgi:hypothetical protein